jgi:glycosyltransferase involved in cell wall biosynthesis
MQKKFKTNGRYFNIGVFGYLSQQKNQIEAINAVSNLKEKEKYKLYLIGDGNIDEYKSYGKKIGLENQLVFTGFVRDVASYYSALDLILVCSTHEALGRITIEGMLAKKPVIGKRSGATPELIENGKNGLLYDTVPELASKIEYLYKNPEESTRIAKMGQVFAVTNFSSGKSIDALYNEIQRLA